VLQNKPDRELTTHQQAAGTSVFAGTIAFGSELIALPGVAAPAVNPLSAQRLWELSERLLEVSGHSR
jgi:hypothetical protein